MFGLFLVSAPLAFLCMLLAPLSVFSRWATVPVAILTFLCAFTTTAACAIGTAMSVVLREVIKRQIKEINISAEVGIKMLVFMWIAAGFSIIGCLIQLGMCCCCASRRDVRIGRKIGRRSAYGDGETPELISSWRREKGAAVETDGEGRRLE